MSEKIDHLEIAIGTCSDTLNPVRKNPYADLSCKHCQSYEGISDGTTFDQLRTAMLAFERDHFQCKKESGDEL